MNIIWFNPDINRFDYGSRKEFIQLKIKSTAPHRVLALERFYAESPKIISKIVKELNKLKRT